MDGGKRCENANVDDNTFMRFQGKENRGFRKRISVDGASFFYAVWLKYAGDMKMGSPDTCDCMKIPLNYSITICS